MRAPLFLLFLAVLFAGCDPRPVAPNDSGMTMTPRPDGAPPVDPDAGTMPTEDASVRPQTPLVDPHCVDGMYAEPLPNRSADISDLVASYNATQLEPFVFDALARRYGVGQFIVENAQARQDCIGTFLNDTSTASSVIRGLATVVHECGHMYDNSLSSSDSNTYFFRQTVSITASDGDTTSRGGLTFARSRIMDDEYAFLRTPCGGSFGTTCDFYADIYLDGDPDDGAFDSGDQGFDSLLEETVQYINSLATAYAFSSELAGPYSVSERDGILTFLWYTMRYLRMARLSYPSAYSLLATGGGGAWRRAILTAWGRAWLYLEATEGMSHLGLADEAIEALVLDADLLSEIQRLRDAEGCAL